MVWRRVEPPGVWRTTRRLTGRRGCASGTSTPVDPCRFLCVCVVIGRRRARARAVHEVVVELVGELPPPEIQGLAGPKVRVTGPVPSVTPHVARAAVIAAPTALRRRDAREGSWKRLRRASRSQEAHAWAVRGLAWGSMPDRYDAPVREGWSAGPVGPIPRHGDGATPARGALERRIDRVRRHRPRRGASRAAEAIRKRAIPMPGRMDRGVCGTWRAPRVTAPTGTRTPAPSR
jgi:hypothetical protein